MNLSQLAEDLKAHFAEAEQKAKSWLEERLPELASLADKAAGNDLVDAALNVLHLSPAVLSGMAVAIRQADADLGAAKAAAEQAAAEQAAQVPPDPAADPAAQQPQVIAVDS